jgi:DNA-directed RNA polymerase alpha subunit
MTTEELEEATFDSIGFPARLTNVLEEGLGVIYVADLCCFTAAELLALPNFGEKLLTQVRDGLAAVGASLAHEDPPSRAPPVRVVKPAGYSHEIEAFG